MYQNNRRRRFTGIVIIVMILVISFSPYMRSYFLLPMNQKISVGDQIKLDLLFPSSILENFVVQIESEKELTNKNCFKLDNKDWPVALEPGTITMYLKLFGIISLKEMVVDVLPQKNIIPSGHSIGVMVKSKGITIVGYSSIIDKYNNEISLAKDAGLLVGDVILKANSKKIDSDDQLIKIASKCGKENKVLNITVERNGKLLDFKIKPQYCYETKNYRIGLYVRDTAAGIGTMTFYNPETKKYAALGHIIANTEIQNQINKGVGRILEASIQGVQEGKRGNPGEKLGIFMENKGIKGIITKNSRFGIYGNLSKLPNNSYYKKPIPVAYQSQIKEGYAEILTVINGDQIEKFSIEIEKLIPYQKINGKGLIIKVTDPKLLNITGGIIQGMSGSPIIQNGKLVGAVTHVFVNDPARGYGILAEWMLEELSEYKKINLSLLQPDWGYFFWLFL